VRRLGTPAAEPPRDFRRPVPRQNQSAGRSARSSRAGPVCGPSASPEATPSEARNITCLSCGDWRSRDRATRNCSSRCGTAIASSSTRTSAKRPAFGTSTAMNSRSRRRSACRVAMANRAAPSRSKAASALGAALDRAVDPGRELSEVVVPAHPRASNRVAGRRRPRGEPLVRAGLASRPGVTRGLPGAPGGSRRLRRRGCRRPP